MVGGNVGRLASELSTLTKERRYDEAIALAQRSLRQYPDSVVLLREARIAFTKAGALTLHLEPTRAQRRIADITKTKNGLVCHATGTRGWTDSAGSAAPAQLIRRLASPLPGAGRDMATPQGWPTRGQTAGPRADAGVVQFTAA
jgi:hypothetical protein